MKTNKNDIDCMKFHHIAKVVINLRGVSTNKKYYMFYRHAILQRTCLKLFSYHDQNDANEIHFGLLGI